MAESKAAGEVALCDFEFCANKYSDEQLRAQVWEIAQLMGVVETTGKSKEEFEGFLKAVQAKMHDNPYHKYMHICDVTQVRGLPAAVPPSTAAPQMTAAHCVQEQITGGNPKAFANMRVALVRAPMS